MKRREFITLLGGAAPRGRSRRARSSPSGCGASACSWPQPRRSGIRRPVSARSCRALQELGWTDGRNVRIDTRWGTTDAEPFARHAAELVALAPDVILALASRRGAAAAGDPHRADRVRAGGRPGRRRLR